MRVKGYELDYLFCNSLGYNNVGEMLCQYSVKKYKELKYKFIKDNNITILRYKGDEKYGDEIYDCLLELKEFLDNRIIKTLYDFETDLPKSLIDLLRDMKVITKEHDRYKWSGSKNYQAITIILLKYYENN